MTTLSSDAAGRRPGFARPAASRRAHYLAVYGRQRPAETLVRTAMAARFMVRMGPPVLLVCGGTPGRGRGAPHCNSGCRHWIRLPFRRLGHLRKEPWLLPEPTGPVGPVHWGSYLGDLLERVMAVTTPLRVTLPTFSDSTRTWSPTSTIVASSGRDELRRPPVFPRRPAASCKRCGGDGRADDPVVARSRLRYPAYAASMTREDLLAM
jgi:hypothetical protein